MNDYSFKRFLGGLLIFGTGYCIGAITSPYLVHSATSESKLEKSIEEEILILEEIPEIETPKSKFDKEKYPDRIREEDFPVEGQKNNSYKEQQYIKIVPNIMI